MADKQPDETTINETSGSEKEPAEAVPTASGSTGAADKPKPKGRFSLPKPRLPFGKKDSKEEDSEVQAAEATPSEAPAEPLEPDEVINLLDPHIKITDEPETEKLERKLNETIDQTKHTHSVGFRVNIVKMLLVAGLLILLYPVYLYAPSFINSAQMEQIITRIPFLPKDEIPQEDQPIEQEESTATVSAQIRIRFEPEQIQTRDAIRALLVNSGYSDIELIEDTELEPGIELASKVENSALRETLFSLLSSTYSVSSESAILSTDSDFDAVILVGKL